MLKLAALPVAKRDKSSAAQLDTAVPAGSLPHAGWGRAEVTAHCSWVANQHIAKTRMRQLRRDTALFAVIKIQHMTNILKVF